MQSQDESIRRELREPMALRIWRPESSVPASQSVVSGEQESIFWPQESDSVEHESARTVESGTVEGSLEELGWESMGSIVPIRALSIETSLEAAAHRWLHGSLEALGERDSEEVGRHLRVVGQEDDDPPPPPSETAYIERAGRAKRALPRALKSAIALRIHHPPAAVKRVAGVRRSVWFTRRMRVITKRFTVRQERTIRELPRSFARPLGLRLSSIAALSADGPLSTLASRCGEESLMIATSLRAGSAPSSMHSSPRLQLNHRARRQRAA